MAASSSQERNISNVDASDLSTVEELKKLLIETGSELLKPCDSTEELLRKLDNSEHVLCRTTQDHKSLVALALQPPKEALIAKEIIRHAEDVRVSVASCISEIIRITAPDEPYEDDHLKEYFQLVYRTFKSLSCMSGRASTQKLCQSLAPFHTVSHAWQCWTFGCISLSAKCLTCSSKS